MSLGPASTRYTPAEILACLERDSPLFHSIQPEALELLAAAGYPSQAGDCSWAVGTQVLRWIAEHVGPGMTTAETGAGHTTVVFAALARHHHCHTLFDSESAKIGAYLEQRGIGRDRVSFAIGPSDQTLPQLVPEAPLDFVFIDGCHGYPFPALDWHHLDRHLKVGGLLGMDDAEIRPVRDHCRFLEENGSYELVEQVGADSDGYFVRFYRKLRYEEREWVFQRYSRPGQNPPPG